MKDETKLEAQCLCGAVHITIAQRPDYLHNCNCPFCTKSGAVWGYFNEVEVEISGTTQSYVRTDLPDPAVRTHFCPACGATTHWSFTEARKQKPEPSDSMGANMRLFDPADLIGVELRYPDGKGWDRGPEFGYYREAVILAEGDSL